MPVLAPGAFELGWEKVPRGPVTRELALGASGVAQGVPALVDTLTTSPNRAFKGEGGGAFLSPALNVTLFYILENCLRGLGSSLGWVGCVTLGKLLSLSGPQSFFFKIVFVCLFVCLREGEGRGEGEKYRCVRDTLIYLLHTSNWGPGLQPRRVP